MVRSSLEIESDLARLEVLYTHRRITPDVDRISRLVDSDPVDTVKRKEREERYVED